MTILFAMTRILVIKTAALGDVLRTTSILPGLAQAFPDLEVTWVTAHAARPLVEGHRLIHVVEGVTPGDAHEVRLLERALGERRWDRVLSFDDEEPLCAMATTLAAAEGTTLSGAYLDENGERAYTDDVAPWFDMGLISRFGKERADELKKENAESHPSIFARMLDVEMGKPELSLPPEATAFAEEFSAQWELDALRPVIGINTGAGGRWKTKELSVERTAELARQIAERRPEVTFLVLGGPEEVDRNRELVTAMRSLEPPTRVIDGGTSNGLSEFAALVGLCDLVVVSDSMALHMAIAQDRKIVCFFAPTSAAEIELYGLGEKVHSTAPDYCSYRRDADNSSITPELLRDKVFEVLGR